MAGRAGRSTGELGAELEAKPPKESEPRLDCGKGMEVEGFQNKLNSIIPLLLSPHYGPE